MVTPKPRSRKHSPKFRQFFETKFSKTINKKPWKTTRRSTKKKKGWPKRVTLQGINISPWYGIFEDDVPFPQVGYVSFPRRYSPLFRPLLHKSQWAWSTASSTAPAAWSAADHELGGLSGDCWIPFVDRTLHIKPACNVDIHFEIPDLEILMISKKVWEKSGCLSEKFDMKSYIKNYSTLGSQKSAARTEDPKLWCHLQLRRYNRNLGHLTWTTSNAEDVTGTDFSFCVHLFSHLWA